MFNLDNNICYYYWIIFINTMTNLQNKIIKCSISLIKESNYDNIEEYVKQLNLDSDYERELINYLKCIIGLILDSDI